MTKLIKMFVVVALLITSVAGAQTFSTSGPATPLTVSDAAIMALVAPATPTFTVHDTAKIIGTTPAGCHSVWIVASGAINVGSPTITTGAAGGIPVADGGVLKLNLRQDTTAPAIYVINSVPGATCTVRLVYGK